MKKKTSMNRKKPMKPKELPNGCTTTEPLVLPESFSKKAVCGCGFTTVALYPFIRGGRLWIRVRHDAGAGFCEMPARNHPEAL